jgi:hypothetical protein
MYLVINNNDDVIYQTLSLEEAALNCPEGCRVVAEHERYYMVF